MSWFFARKLSRVAEDRFPRTVKRAEQFSHLPFFKLASARMSLPANFDLNLKFDSISSTKSKYFETIFRGHFSFMTELTVSPNASLSRYPKITSSRRFAMSENHFRTLVFWEKETNIQTLNNRVSCGSTRVKTEFGIIRKKKWKNLNFCKKIAEIRHKFWLL